MKPLTKTEWLPQAIPPGTRVMVQPDPIFGEQYEGLVGIVQEGDPYPGDARYPKPSGYLTIKPENYSFSRMFFRHTRLRPFDKPSVNKCFRCGKFHWRENETCPKRQRKK